MKRWILAAFLGMLASGMLLAGCGDGTPSEAASSQTETSRFPVAEHDDAKRLDLEIQTEQPTYTMVDVRRNRPLSLTVTNRTGQALLLDDLRWEYFELEWEHDGVWYVLPPEGERAITEQYVIGDLPPGESAEIASMWGWDSYEREFEPGHYRVVWSRDDGAWSAGEFDLLDSA